MELSRYRYLMKSPFIIGALALAIGTLGGFELGGYHMRAVLASNNVPDDVDFSPVWKAWQAIDADYVPVVVASSSPIATSSPDGKQKRVWGMISGMTEALNDPYSYFMPPEENKSFSDDMSGAFEGVGMQIDIKDQKLVVVSPIKGSPAEKVGIKSGDQIIKIDNTDTTGMNVTDAVNKIRGPKGTQVALLLLRTGWNTPREIKVTRDVITVPEVTTKARPDGVFVISIATFTSNSPDLFRSEIGRAHV